MATGPAFDDAVATVRANPTLGVGCHIVLTDGVPASDPKSKEAPFGWVQEECTPKLYPAAKGEYMKDVLAEMERLNVTAVVFGDPKSVQKWKDAGGKRITVVGWPELKARDIDVPGDPSSAAFAVVAAAIRPGSDVVVENVGINPLRAGLYTTLKEMGADLVYKNQR